MNIPTPLHQALCGLELAICLVCMKCLPRIPWSIALARYILLLRGHQAEIATRQRIRLLTRVFRLLRAGKKDGVKRV